MRVLLPEIPEGPQRGAGGQSLERADGPLWEEKGSVKEHTEGRSAINGPPEAITERQFSHDDKFSHDSNRPSYGGTFLIETQKEQPRPRTPAPRDCWQPPSDDRFCNFQCASECRFNTPARETTRAGTASVFNDTWPAVDAYDFGSPPETQYFEQTFREPAWVAHHRGEGHRLIPAAMTPSWQTAGRTQQVKTESKFRFRQQQEGNVEQQRPLPAHPNALQPILSRSIGLPENAVPQVSSRVYGGIDEANDPRDSKRTMFRLQSPKPSEPEPIRREIVDTIVPKTTVEERLKFVDMEFAQEVEKFVEVPEVFYNDVIVEVPQVVEVVKIVPKEEIRENITYVPRFETKYIPKYVEVPIIKIVDRYEEVDEIQEVLKPVVKKSVVDCPHGVLKKVANTIHKKVITEKPVPIIKHQDVPVYKRKLEPKIIKEDLVNQTPHFIDIPVPYEKPLVKYVDYPYFVNHYRDNVYPVASAHRVTPVFRQGDHTQVVDVPLPSPYLVTHTSQQYRPPLMNYQVGAGHIQGYTAGNATHLGFEQSARQAHHHYGAHDHRRLSANLQSQHPLPQTLPRAMPRSSLPCPPSCETTHGHASFFRCGG